MNQRAETSFEKELGLVSQYSWNNTHPWYEKTTLTEFETSKRKEEDILKYKRQHLKIRFNYQDKFTKMKIEKALKVHINNSSPYIQNYYSFMQFSNKGEENELKHLLQAEPYRYTFRQVINVCATYKIKLPKQSCNFIILSLFEMYKYILYLFETFKFKDYESLTYVPCLQNIGFNEYYRIILLNPCHSRTGSWKSIRIDDKTIKKGFRQILVESLKALSQHIQEFKDHGIIQFFEQDCRKSISLQTEQNIIKMFYHSFQLYEIPRSLFLFLKQQVEPKLPKTILTEMFNRKQKEAKTNLIDTLKN